MIILVEGIDRVGKTTLCKILSDRFGFPISKDDTRYYGSHNNVDINTEKDNTFVNLIEQGCIDNVIFDRFHLTEYVYSYIERGVKNDAMIDIDNRLSKLDVLLIFVLPVDIKWSSREHGSDLTKHQKLFEKMYEQSKLNKYRCTFYSYDMCINEVERRLNNGTSK